MGDLELLRHRRRRRIHLCRARHRLWHAGPARRRQRFPRRLCGRRPGRPSGRATISAPRCIELYTYRVEGHSTCDDPSRYRPPDEAKAWPLGDPVERLKDHLIALGEWDEDQHQAAYKECVEQVRAADKQASSYGTLGHGEKPSLEDHVRRRLQGHALAYPQTTPGNGSLIMPAMNMIQALNSAMDVMLAQRSRMCSSSARMSAISAASSAPPKACRRNTG